MKYNLILRIDDPRLFELLTPELKDGERERSEIRLSRKDSCTLVEINAKDAVALRASVDGIIQLLKAYEKIGRI